MEEAQNTIELIRLVNYIIKWKKYDPVGFVDILQILQVFFEFKNEYFEKIKIVDFLEIDCYYTVMEEE